MSPHSKGSELFEILPCGDEWSVRAKSLGRIERGDFSAEAFGFNELGIARWRIERVRFPILADLSHAGEVCGARAFLQHRYFRRLEHASIWLTQITTDQTNLIGVRSSAWWKESAIGPEAGPERQGRRESAPGGQSNRRADVRRVPAATFAIVGTQDVTTPVGIAVLLLYNSGGRRYAPRNHNGLPGFSPVGAATAVG
jgi:hypothetical protein